MIPGIDVLVGSAVGAIGGVIQRWQERKQIEKQHEFDLEMANIEIQERNQEMAHEAKMAHLGMDLARVEGELRVEQAEVGSFTESVKQQGKLTGNPWIDGFCKMVRPLTTYVLLGFTIWITSDLWSVVGGLEAFDESQAIVMFQTIIDKMLFLTVLSISWWFSSRVSNKKLK